MFWESEFLGVCVWEIRRAGTVLDEAGEVLLEQKLATTLRAMKEVFGGMPRSRIALETGMPSPWVSRLQRELQHEVIVSTHGTCA
jgi:hypothetical protein